MRHIPFDLDRYREQMQELIGDVQGVEVFWNALDFAVEAHDNQWRRSGDAYILHPCSVARILAAEMDISNPEILAAALLHDTIEDVPEVTPELVEERFGGYVRSIVEGCTKVTHASGDKQANSRNTHRKIFTGASLLPEVMLVKLADRLHNLRTLRAMPKAKRQRIADETLDIYAPLATFFGLFNMKREMYSLALLFKSPRQSAKVNNTIRQLEQSPLGKGIVATLEQKMLDEGVVGRVTARTRQLGAYYSMRSRLLLTKIDTPVEILIVVSDVSSCYRALGVVNQTFKPIPRTIRDFIANAKPTGYQGLHARAMIEGQKFLFKIRTTEMERKAQKGLFRDLTSKVSNQSKFFKEIKEMFDVLGSEEIISYRDVIAASGIKEIYTYTPKGDLIILPVNSTVLDFAFRVHSQVGHTCIGAVIRNQRVSSSHILSDGAMVRIIRAKEPVRFTTNIQELCKTARARGELAKSFRVRRRVVTTAIGESLLRQEMLSYGIPFDSLEGEKLSLLLKEHSSEKLEDLYVRIGEGVSRLRAVMVGIKNIFYDGESPLVAPTGAFNSVELTTLDPVSLKLSSCCKPNPVNKNNCAFLTQKGLSVHDKNCVRFSQLKFQREDAVNVFWRARETRVRKVQSLRIHKANRKDLMRAVGFAPEGMELRGLEVLANFSSQTPSWRMHFVVANLYILQQVLRHFDKSRIVYEFEIAV